MRKYTKCSIELIFFIIQVTADALNENEAHPRRLQFGFAPELEKLIHDKVESSADLYVTLQFFSVVFFFLVIFLIFIIAV